MEGSESRHCGADGGSVAGVKAKEGGGGEGRGGQPEQGIMGGIPKGRKGLRFLASAPGRPCKPCISLSHHAKANKMC